MESRAIDELLSSYRASAAAHHEPNDGSAAWIARVNRAADQMLLIARRVADSGPDAVARFAELVQSDDPHLSVWAAHHLLDFMQMPVAIRESALAVIERAAGQPSPQSAGEQSWLENWRDEQQDE